MVKHEFNSNKDSFFYNPPKEPYAYNEPEKQSVLDWLTSQKWSAELFIFCSAISFGVNLAVILAYFNIWGILYK